MMKAKTLILMLLLTVALGVHAFAGEVAISSVTAQQRYPWNGLVDIIVTIQGSPEDVAKVDCRFAATNSATKAAIPVQHTTQNGADSGSDSTFARWFVWDAKADVGAVKIDDVALTVDLKSRGGVQLWKSGPCWAEYNVGATKPTEYGYYFWWGDTVGYKLAPNGGWIAANGSRGFAFSSGNCPTYDKNDFELRSAGYIDSTGNLVAKHDAATAYWGAPWRMPTGAEFSALVSNCDTEWTSLNGVFGCLVKGRGDYASKSIFLPAAGEGQENRLGYFGSVGYYWSSTLYSGHSDNTLYLYCGSDIGCSHWFPYLGMSVRPVRGFASGDFTMVVALSGVTTHFAMDCREEAQYDAVDVEWVDRQTCYDCDVDLFEYDDGKSETYEVSKSHCYYYDYGIQNCNIYAPGYNDCFRLFSRSKYSTWSGPHAWYYLVFHCEDLVLPSSCIVEYSAETFSLERVMNFEKYGDYGYHNADKRIIGSHGGSLFFPSSISWSAPLLLSGDQCDKYGILFTGLLQGGYGEQYETEVDGFVYSAADVKLVGDERKMLMRPKELQIAWLRDTDDYDVENDIGYYPVDKSRANYLSFETAILPAPQGAFRIPDGLPIEGIGSEALKNCSSLTEITLPTNVIYLAARAFVGCDSMSNIICEGYCEVDADAFKGCSKLKSAYFLGGCNIADLDVVSDFTGLASSRKHPANEGRTINLANGGTLSFASMTMSPMGAVKSDGAVKVSMSASHGLKIIYTTDGSEPSANNGLTYESALRVSGPIIVKAASFLYGHQMTPIKVLRVRNDDLESPTVRFVPAGGAHFTSMSQQVEIVASCDDAEIFYTLDGSEPTDASLRYAAPIQVSETTTIKAVAYRGGRLVEGQIGQAVFTRDERTVSAPTILPQGISEFDHSNLQISIECATKDATIYYTLNGRDPLVAGEIYQGPFTISETTVVRAVAVCEGYKDSPKAKVEFSRIWHKVATPSVSPGTKVSFTGSKTFVSAECGTDGATLYYCANAVPTETNRIKYTGPIEVVDSTVINFIAVKDDWRDSDVVSVEVEKVWQYGDGVGDPDRKFTSGGGVSWARDVGVFHEGAESLRSGKIDDGGSSWIETVIDAAGTVSFWWKTSCEDDQDDATADWDHLAFFTNGVEVCRIDGVTAWREVKVFCPGPTTLRWEYVKDENEFANEDCGWIDGFSYQMARSVTFDANGGKVDVLRTLYKDGVVDQLPTPVRSGFLFVGWFKSKVGVDEVVKGDLLTQDLTLYAHWGVKTCIVTFDSNGGRGEMDSQVFSFGKMQAIYEWGFFRDNYHFAGWALTPDGDVAYKNKQVVCLTSETGKLTLYARWEPGIYYDEDGIGWGDAEGFSWYFVKEGDENAIVQCYPQLQGEDLIIPSHIGDDIVTRVDLSFGGHGGSRIGTPKVLELREGIQSFCSTYHPVDAQAVIIPPSTTSFSPAFCFWGSDDGSRRVAWTLSGMPISAQINAFGMDTHTKCVVVALGGVPDGFLGVAGRSFVNSVYFWCKRQYYKDWVAAFGEGMFLGYVDDAWQYEDDVCGYAEFIVDSNVYAREPYWKGMKYAPFVEDPLDGKRLFLGWYSSEVGGSQVRAGDDVVALHRKIYARFVGLDPVGGTLPNEYDLSKALPSATKSCCAFKGWFTERDGGAQITSLAGYEAESNSVLYAHWQPMKYSVVLDGGDGAKVVPFGDVLYGDEFTPTNECGMRPGSRFLGWSMVAGGGLVYPAGSAISNLTTTAGAEVRLYAVWGEAELTSHSFRQRYPWNGLVDVDFSLNGDVGFEYPLMLEVLDCIGRTNLPVRTILNADRQPIGNPFVTQSGKHRVIWNADADLPDGYKCQYTSARLRHVVAVRFDACGGECETESQYYVLNEGYGDLPIPVKEGFAFKGWYSDAEYKEAVTRESLAVPSVAILYAKWETEK